MKRLEKTGLAFLPSMLRKALPFATSALKAPVPAPQPQMETTAGAFIAGFFDELEKIAERIQLTRMRPQ